MSVRGRRMDAGPFLFQLDIEHPFASFLLDALLTAGAIHGVRLRWGSVRGNLLQLEMDGDVNQQDIADVLHIKILESETEHPPGTAEACASPEVAEAVPVFQEPSL